MNMTPDTHTMHQRRTPRSAAVSTVRRDIPTGADPVERRGRPWGGRGRGLLGALAPWAAITAAVLTPGAALAGMASAQAPQKPERSLEAIARMHADRFVRVEYHLRTDRGEDPMYGLWAHWCPGCAAVHAVNLAELLEDERPAVRAGVLLDDRRVILTDPVIEPRFVARLEVVRGQVRRSARPVAFGRDATFAVLELDEPVPGVTPIPFTDAPVDAGLIAVTAAEEGAAWLVAAAPLSGGAMLRDGRPMRSVPAGALLVTADGAPVAYCAESELALDRRWAGQAALDRVLDMPSFDSLRALVDRQADATIHRVLLLFRSPRSEDAFDWRSGPEEAATEQSVPGILISPTRIVVLALLTPEQTARLEHIVLEAGDAGDGIDATFVGTLRDVGAFVAELASPLPPPAPLATAEDLPGRFSLLGAAIVRIFGEQRTVDVSHDRVQSEVIGPRGRAHPLIVGPDDASFLFDESGRLTVIPLTTRPRVAAQPAYGPAQAHPHYAHDLRAMLDAGEQAFDPANRPLSEEEESRLAWLGVEMQALGRELARARGVSRFTRDGEIGGLVSHIYPDSPAALAGLRLGDILLEIHAASQPRPIEVAVDSDHPFADGFPWEFLDQLPEHLFDKIPTPWAPADDGLTRRLTQLGFGSPIEIDVYRDGSRQRIAMHVEQGPPTWVSTPRALSTELGLTIRDFTYETRRYFRRDTDDPGVIISMIETGSRAATTGLKPFEIITHVNDQPVTDVRRFVELVSGERDLRLTVRRMTRSRIVRIELDAPVPSPEDGDGDLDDDRDDDRDTEIGSGDPGR